MSFVKTPAILELSHASQRCPTQSARQSIASIVWGGVSVLSEWVKLPTTTALFLFAILSTSSVHARRRAIFNSTPTPNVSVCISECWEEYYSITLRRALLRNPSPIPIEYIYYFALDCAPIRISCLRTSPSIYPVKCYPCLLTVLVIVPLVMVDKKSFVLFVMSVSPIQNSVNCIASVVQLVVMLQIWFRKAVGRHLHDRQQKKSDYEAPGSCAIWTRTHDCTAKTGNPQNLKTVSSTFGTEHANYTGTIHFQQPLIIFTLCSELIFGKTRWSTRDLVPLLYWYNSVYYIWQDQIHSRNWQHCSFFTSSPLYPELYIHFVSVHRDDAIANESHLENDRQ